MRRGQKLAHRADLEMPFGLDPSGVPCEGFGCLEVEIAKLVHIGGPLEAVARASVPLETVARVPQPPTGLAPASKIASVEEVAMDGETESLLWGSFGDRPVLFAVEAGAAAEMEAALRVGEHASAIVEPSQVLLERLD